MTKQFKIYRAMLNMGRKSARATELIATRAMKDEHLTAEERNSLYVLSSLIAAGIESGEPYGPELAKDWQPDTVKIAE